jgi:hypothetical protein
MIVNIIDIPSFTVFKSESHPPVSPHRDCPGTPQLAFKQMQSESRQIQIANRNCGIESSQNVTQFFNMLADHSARSVIFVKAFKPL